MAYVFEHDGIILGIDQGEPRFDQYIKNHDFPEGTIYKKIDKKEIENLISIDQTKPRSADPPYEKIRQLKDRYEALLSVLEDELKLPKGNLLEKIDLKIKEQGK